MMLKNEKQYKSARVALQKWLNNLNVLEARVASQAVEDWLIEEERFAINQQIEQLQAEIQEFDDIVEGKRKLPPVVLHVDTLPTLLIGWRLAKHWTQKQLAERAGIHENLLQKYESENYSCASLQTISKIAHILQKDESTNPQTVIARLALACGLFAYLDIELALDIAPYLEHDRSGR
jgi:transcriptional regulator with XRE-family HTH domain